ncbi:MAG: prephenate dehydrogenase/arogenate dehydrogenase family protein [Chloroflexi bacterium]|nr:prephenate dehydrogenase/arogenate dehydrogenase family protein [Chloroflexota bacterium]
MAQITIIGLGLIGGSLGLALKRAKTPYEIVGYNRSRENANKAKRVGAVDRIERDLAESVKSADLVIVATPVGVIPEIFRTIATELPQGCVVSDAASTKAQVLAWAGELLPDTVDFVGGHPMAGKETSGIDVAEASLFDGAVYCVVPSTRASQRAIETITGLASVVGATPYFIDATEHDSHVAAISHLPFVAATALVNVATGATAWRDIARLAASGFRDTTRLASGDPVMYRDIVGSNRESLIRWIDAYVTELTAIRSQIQAGEDTESVFRRAQQARDEWQRRKPDGGEPNGPAIELPSTSERLSSLFFPTRRKPDSR